MAEVIPYASWHIDKIKELARFAYLKPFIDGQYYKEAERYPSITVIEGDRFLGCGGIVPLWEGRGEGWAILDSESREHFIKVHRAVKTFLKNQPFNRIEATVDCDFEAGHRWVKLLGFTLEAPRMRAYRVGGKDAALYSMIKGVGV